ncbi:MAG: ornithine carbamoyltransferase [Phycisphaerales bacterium]|nr:ornithine carbamoyltransferase [Phycisphaerales bacterium]
MTTTKPILMTRDLLQIVDLSATEIAELFALSARMKSNYADYATALAQRSLAMLFEKPSLRTRVSFELGFQKLGGGVTFLDHQSSPIGGREPVEDYARNLSRWVDVVAIRCQSHQLLQRFAAASSVPVINALSDLHHPCQALADLFTLVETGIPVEQLHLVWVGDGNNVCHSLIETVATIGGRMTVITPPSCKPPIEIMRVADARACRSGARIVCTADLGAVTGADAVYTDVWVSMGEEARATEKIALLTPYRVDGALMKRAGSQARFMHCLPAKRGEEVTAEVIDSPASIVFDQAENRMHVQNALMLALLRPDLARGAIAHPHAALTP